MTVNRYATQAGRKYQRELAKYLRDVHFIDAESLSLSGAEDEGDVILRAGGGLFVIEAKRTKAFTPADWVTQAEVEAGNYARHRNIETPAWLAVASRRNHSIGKSYVITSLDEWVRQAGIAGPRPSGTDERTR